jgi:hypothetical protein
MLCVLLVAVYAAAQSGKPSPLDAAISSPTDLSVTAGGLTRGASW